MENISKNENLVPFRGIINNIFECCLKEECEKQNEIWIHLLANPRLNLELYTKVHNYVNDFVENNNVLQLFKEMCEKYDTLMRKEYYYQGKEKEDLYCFTPSFVFKDGKYYIYNFWESVGTEDKANYLPLIAINGVPIKEIVERLKKIGLTEKQAYMAMTGVGLLKYIGVPDDRMCYEVENNNEIITLQVSNYSGFEFDYNILKNGGANIQEMYNLQPKSYEKSSDESIDNYSYSIFQKCLMILNGISSNNYDRSVLQDLFSTTDIESYVTNDNHFNAMIMITYLMNDLEEVLEIAPDNIKKELAIRFLDIIYKGSKSNYFINENNELEIMTPGEMANRPEFNSKDFLKSIKNGFAHFSYTLDDEYITVHGVNILGIYQDIQIPMKLSLLSVMFDTIINSINLSNSLPILFEDRHIVYGEKLNPLSSLEEVSSYLDILRLSNNEVVGIIDRKMNTLILDEFAEVANSIGRIHNILEYNENRKKLYAFDPLFDLKFDLVSMNNDIREYILEKVSQYEGFFNMDIYDQKNYIKDLIRYKVSKEKVTDDIIFDLINTNDKAAGDIHYMLERYTPLKKEKVIRVLINTIMNTLYLITNGKYEDYEDFDVNYDNMGLFSRIDNTFEKTKLENELSQLRAQYSNIEKELVRIGGMIDSYKKQLSNPKVPEHVKLKISESLESLEQEIVKLPNTKIQVQNTIAQKDAILESMNNDLYVMNPHDVIRHIRNGISHNNIEVLDVNINNIMSTKIIVNDFDEKDGSKQTFHCETNLEELLRYINNKEFLQSIFKRNIKI